MRILHTEWSDGLGGQEKRVLAELEGMANRGHYAALVCREHAKMAQKLSIDVFTLPMRRLYDVTSIINLAGILKKKRFDIVNTHSGVDSWIGGIAAKIAGVPALIRTRHLNIPLKRNMLNFIHYLPDMYITCGENMRNNLVQNCGFPFNKVISIPTGVGEEFFRVTKNPQAKTRYGLAPETPVITNVGILRSVKGHEVTLNAVKIVIEHFPDAKFLIVGNGPAKKRLENMACDTGIAKHVVFTGFIENIPEVYSISDVAVLSSWSEGLPQSMLQAMAAGVPVVATRVGGVPEVVIHEKTGLLVDAGDYNALARGIIRILENPGVALDFAKNARELVKREHPTSHMLNNIESLYSRLLNNE